MGDPVLLRTSTTLAIATSHDSCRCLHFRPESALFSRKVETRLLCFPRLTSLPKDEQAQQQQQYGQASYALWILSKGADFLWRACSQLRVSAGSLEKAQSASDPCSFQQY
jgi:hypothetical protein